MTTTDAQRLHLLEAARRTWDDQAADTLLAALPPGADDLATTDDLRVVGAQLRTETAVLGADLRTEIADLRTDLRTEMAELRNDMIDRFADQTRAMAEQTRTIATQFEEQGRHISDVQRILLIAMVTLLISGVGLAFVAAR